MDKMYFKFVDGRLERISALPKLKDGHSYFIVETKDGLPTKGYVAEKKHFDGSVEEVLETQKAGEKEHLDNIKSKQEKRKEGKGVTVDPPAEQ